MEESNKARERETRSATAPLRHSITVTVGGFRKASLTYNNTLFWLTRHAGPTQKENSGEAKA